MVKAGFEDFDVLVAFILEGVGHAITVHPFHQCRKLPVGHPRRRRVNVFAVFALELGDRAGSCGGVPASLAQHHLVLVDVSIDVHLSGECAGVMDRGIDVLASSGFGAVHECGHNRHIGVMAASMPGVSATWGDGNLIRGVHRIVAAAAHLTSRREVEQVAA